jgi:hypothetical protein
MAAIDNFRRHINDLIANKKTSIMAIHKGTGIARNLLYGYLVEGKGIDLNRAEEIAHFLGFPLSAAIGEEAPAQAPFRKPTPEELIYALLEHYPLETMRKRICLLALTADADLIKTMHDTSLKSYFKRVERRAADDEKSSVG